MDWGRETIVVGAPDVTTTSGVARWSVPVSGPSGMPSTIWYEVPTEWAGMLTDRADPALVALTIPAMRLGLPLRIDGPVNEDLAFSYPDLQALYAASGDRPVVGTEFRNTVRAARASSSAVAAGFSAGIDSYALLADHHYAASVPDPLRLTHLLFNNVGSHAHGHEELWRRRFSRLAPVAEHIGLPFIPVNSNLDSIPSPGISYEPLNSPANASVAHLLAGGLSGWIFGSSVEFRRVGVAPRAYNSAFVDPIAMPLMSTGSLWLRVASSRMRRIDKARQVAEIPDAWTSLDVCIGTEPGAKANCSQCWKCRMTLAALDLIGAVDRFDAQFDLGVWRRDRGQYLARVTFARNPALIRELNELMEETGYHPSARERWKAARQIFAEDVASQAMRVRRRSARLYRQATGSSSGPVGQGEATT